MQLYNSTQSINIYIYVYCNDISYNKTVCKLQLLTVNITTRIVIERHYFSSRHNVKMVI